jgi:hypothetical protein
MTIASLISVPFHSSVAVGNSRAGPTPQISPPGPGSTGEKNRLCSVSLKPQTLSSREKTSSRPTTGRIVRGPWTVGTLANHIWSYAGDDDRTDVSQTFIQPFVAFALGNGQTIALNSESTYNWEAEQWTVPVNLQYTKVLTIGKQPMSFQFGGRYYPEKPEDGPDWGLRATITFLFPSQ